MFSSRAVMHRGNAVLRRSIGRQGRRNATLKRGMSQHCPVVVALPRAVFAPVSAEASLPRGWDMIDTDDDGG